MKLALLLLEYLNLLTSIGRGGILYHHSVMTIIKNIYLIIFNKKVIK